MLQGFIFRVEDRNHYGEDADDDGDEDHDADASPAVC